MAIEIVPTGAAAGVEIRGADLSKPVAGADLDLIEAALDTHGVIVLRDQQITPEQHIAFSRRFGPLEHNFNSDTHGLPGQPEIFLLSNIVENGRAIGAKRAGETWHSDMSYAARPPRATMLHAVEVPELFGLPLGDTQFANAAAAWDALPEAMQRHIEGRKAIFDFRGRKRARGIDETIARRYPPVQHPIVRTHARTGRKSLYVMHGDCTGIVGMEQDEAALLIEALAAHVVRPEFVYRHRWRKGDIVVWDNCTVQHKAVVDYDLPQRRLMWRSTMQGPPPA